jgi:hypothetical protein
VNLERVDTLTLAKELWGRLVQIAHSDDCEEEEDS